MEVYVGLDVSHKRTEICVMEASGAVLLRSAADILQQRCGLGHCQQTCDIVNPRDDPELGQVCPSARCARIAFVTWVSWRTRKSRVRCIIRTACCASVHPHKTACSVA